MNKLYNNRIDVSQSSPCIHCGKPDWCYRTSNTVHLCNRQIEPAPGWYRTTKKDQQGKFYYAPKHPQKAASPTGKITYNYTDREGNPLVRVVRINGQDGSKKIWQEHFNGKRWVKGLKGIDRNDIPVYRYQEIQQAIASEETIYIVEGEKCADLLFEKGLFATTNLGGSGKWLENHNQDLSGAKNLVICPDRDLPGINHALRISESFPKAHWLYAPPSDYFWDWNKLPSSGGLDVADWIAEANPTSQELFELVTSKSPNLFLTGRISPPEVENQQIIEPVEMHTQKAVDALFSDAAYISIHEELYKWNGTHYEKLSTPKQRRRILEWAKKTPQESARGQWKYTLATPAKVNEIWSWVLFNFAVAPEEINPPGINCLNGTVTIKWLGRKPKISLTPHSPDNYYTYTSQLEYDPSADETDCDRLLMALDPAQRTIFLRTIAASLDLNKIRSLNVGNIKALLCQGTGSNGKDAIRQAVRMILADGMTSASLTDFKAYDEGKKFYLAKLENARINWASENSSFVKLDSIQVLKEAITGEPIDVEFKGVQDYAVEPKSVFLFNINEAPLIDGGLQAIKRRYAVLNFNKTFTHNANPLLGEIEADARFRYDPNFLNERVCPALLNKILRELENVASEGIDYDAAEKALQEMQEDSNHLWAFCNEIGLRYSPGDRMYIKDLYARLEAWYIDSEILSCVRVGDRLQKKWSDPVRKGDKFISASFQLFPSLKRLFPKISKKKHTESANPERKGSMYILGLALFGEDIGEARTQSYQHGEDGEDINIPSSQIMMRIKRLTKNQRLQLLGFMDRLENQIENKDEGEVLSSPSSPPHPERVSSSPVSSPRQENAPSSEFNIDATVDIQINTPQFSFNAQGDNTGQADSTYTIKKYDPSKELDWVLLKNGKRLLVEDIKGLKFTGRQAGVKNADEYWLDDCAEFHYKDEQKPEPVT